MINKSLLSSKRYEWETPQDLFDGLDREFGFTTDVCATDENAKCKRFFTIGDDGLKQKWSGVCWMNPPYGRGIIKWMKKAYESSKQGVTVVCLVPARTDTKWWHEFSMKGEIRFIRGRIKFGDRKKDAPFPSAIVIFQGANSNRGR
jgi:phage N-6-adenine-methyltransferase